MLDLTVQNYMAVILNHSLFLGLQPAADSLISDIASSSHSATKPPTVAHLAPQPPTVLPNPLRALSLHSLLGPGLNRIDNHC